MMSEVGEELHTAVTAVMQIGCQSQATTTYRREVNTVTVFLCFPCGEISISHTPGPNRKLTSKSSS
jgi:hypothetical protein